MKYKCQWVVVLLLIAIIVSSITGCKAIQRFRDKPKGDAESEKAVAGYNIFYLNTDETKLRAFAYQLTSTTEEGIIEECLTALKTSPNEKNYTAILDHLVSIDHYEYNKEEKFLALYFNDTYHQLSRTQEMLVRTAIVKTMTQFSGIIDYASFNVNGEWLTDDKGDIMRMKNSDYVVEITGNLEYLADANLNLYFAAPDGSGLIKTYTTLKYYNTSSMASVVLDALLRGPVTEGCRPTLSTNTQVKSVYVKDGVCQVDFNQGFLEKVEEHNFILNVYSVVNSLTELEEVNQVKITVDGQTIQEAPDGVNLADVLTANPSLVVE